MPRNTADSASKQDGNPTAILSLYHCREESPVTHTALLIAAALALSLSALPAVSGPHLDLRPVLTAEAPAHGGGCRKSSPPGQCCHMDNSAGTVHCH